MLQQVREMANDGEVREALVLLDQSHDPIVNNVEATRLRAELLVALDQLDEAESMLERAIKQGQDVHLDMGLVYEAMGEFDKAMASYRAAITHNARNVDARVNWGLLLIQDGKAREAVVLLQEAADLDKKAQWQLADCFLALGEDADALKALEGAVRAGEDRALVDLVELQGDSLPTNMQLEYLARAEKAGSRVARSDLIAVLVDLGRFEEAVASGLSAMDMGDELVVGPLAAAFEGIGDFQRALVLYEQAVQGNEAYEEDVARLRGASEGF